MHDDSVLVAIEDAFRSPAFCVCGNNLTVAIHDDAAWQECAAYARPSRLPRPLATLVRELLHERHFLVDVPPAPAAVQVAIPD